MAKRRPKRKMGLGAEAVVAEIEAGPEETDEEKVVRQRLGKYRAMLPPGMLEDLGSMPWDTIANLATSLKVKTARQNAELKKLEKEISMTEIILNEKINYMNKTHKFDYKFLVDLVHLLEKYERISIEQEINLDEVLMFIYILIEKMKKEKLIVYDRRTGKYAGSAPAKEFGRVRAEVDKWKPK